VSSGYVLQDRGDRLNPQRSNRVYWHLVLLRNQLQRIADTELANGGTILDYGCGSKPYAPLFARKFEHYVGADLAGNKEAELILDPEGRIPSGEGTFDCVLSSQVLEHVGSPETYLAEALRVTKAGGSMILSTHGTWCYHPDPTDYWRWTIDGLQLIIRRAGFEIVSVRSVMGPESVAIQQWQDATYERLPNICRTLYIRFCQACIGLIERRHPDKLTTDASVYIVHARKPLR